MSKASDVRYGRRGGGWLPTRQGDDVCSVCANSDARYRARHRTTGETWQVCTRCRDQGARYSAPVDYTPLHQAGAA